MEKLTTATANLALELSCLALKYAKRYKERKGTDG
jgi:hypothetical protein